MQWPRNASRRFRSGRSQTTREVRSLDHQNAGSPWTEPVRFLRNRVRVRRQRSDDSVGYADLERALRDIGMNLFLQFTADLVPLVLQRIASSRKRPAEHDGLPPASHLSRRPGGPMHA
jgi:hypothetical protein